MGGTHTREVNFPSFSHAFKVGPWWEHASGDESPRKTGGTRKSDACSMGFLKPHRECFCATKRREHFCARPREFSRRHKRSHAMPVSAGSTPRERATTHSAR